MPPIEGKNVFSWTKRNRSTLINYALFSFLELTNLYQKLKLSQHLKRKIIVVWNNRKIYLNLIGSDRLSLLFIPRANKLISYRYRAPYSLIYNFKVKNHHNDYIIIHAECKNLCTSSYSNLAKCKKILQNVEISHCCYSVGPVRNCTTDMRLDTAAVNLYPVELFSIVLNNVYKTSYLLTRYEM
jgi:hypothetical protein